MKGSEHYAEAERLLSEDRPFVSDWQDRPEEAAEHWRATLAEAQVHATLAQVNMLGQLANVVECAGRKAGDRS